MQIGYGMMQDSGRIPEEWLILDSASTNSVFKTCKFLNDIVARDDEECMNLISNGGGSMGYYLKSTIKMFPLEVFYDEKSLSNIMLLFDFVKVPEIIVTMDNRKDYGFNVFYNNKAYHIAPFCNGLYYYNTRATPKDLSNMKGDKPKVTVYSYSYLQTIEDNNFLLTMKLKERKLFIYNKKI